MATLALLVDGVAVKTFVLDTGKLLIGRRPDCDIRIDDASVSGHHALLTVRPSRYLEGQREYLLEDLDSTNGTFVNGRRIEYATLAANDTIRIAWNSFQLIGDETASPDLERTAVILPDEQQ